jgi:hypothetical protein
MDGRTDMTTPTAVFFFAILRTRLQNGLGGGEKGEFEQRERERKNKEK